MSSNISLVQLGKYTTPEISENKRDKWVAYGADNNYYQTLIDAKESPTNSALINGISDMIYGRGLHATNAAKKPDEYAMMVQLFSEDCMRKICDDFYTFGQAAYQVIYDTAHTKVMEVAHMPIQNLRPEKMNEEGYIEAYYYCDDWASAKRGEEHQRIPCFGKSKEGLEVMVIKPYKAGFHYFSPVEYQSGLDYTFVEIELGQFHLNNIYTRFSGSTIINFNNGTPEEEQQRMIESKIKDKFTGTEGDSVIVAFNDSQETAAQIESISLPDAHNQYQFISEEASKKIMVSHRVTSPLLFGLPQNGGLGSNADEIKMAALLFDNTVIKPMQHVIVESVNAILSFNNISLNTFFLTSQPLEFSEMEIEEVDEDTAQEKTGIETETVAEVATVDAEIDEELAQKEASYNGAQIASALQIMEAVSLGTLTKDQAVTFLIQMLQFEPSVANALFSGNAGDVITQMKSQENKSKDNLDDVAELLIEKGEELGEGWELVEESEVDYDEDEKEPNLLSKVYNFVSTGTARPNAKSEQDRVIDGVAYKTRYVYAPDAVQANSRPFCKKMVAANKLYRKEDIIAMGDKAVNAGWGLNGASTYSIWKWKGGGACHHKWMRRVFRKPVKDGKIDTKSPLAPTVSTNKSEKEGYRVRNPKEVAMRPIDRGDKGFVNK